jgi:hypothetical protein
MIFRSTDRNLRFEVFGAEAFLAPCGRIARRPGERNIRIGRYEFYLFLLFFLVQGKKCLNIEVETARILKKRFQKAQIRLRPPITAARPRPVSEAAMQVMGASSRRELSIPPGSATVAPERSAAAAILGPCCNAPCARRAASSGRDHATRQNAWRRIARDLVVSIRSSAGFRPKSPQLFGTRFRNCSRCANAARRWSRSGPFPAAAGPRSIRPRKACRPCRRPRRT